MNKTTLFLLFIFQSLTPIFATCIWYTPSAIFPPQLVRLVSPLLHQQRRLSEVAITAANVSNGDAGGISTSPGHPPPPNGDIVHEGFGGSLSGPDSTTIVHNGGLDQQGRVQYSVMYDASLSIPSLDYRLESITPLTVTPKSLSGTISLVDLDHSLFDALSFEETLIVTLSAWSSCLSTRALSETTYRFDVAASYNLFYNYTNHLAPNDNANLVSVQVPQSNATHKWVQTPCLYSLIQSSLHVLNTSRLTHWPSSGPPQYTAVGGIGPPRCHFKGHGSVCTVVARARFEYGRVCSHPTTFSLWQSVSQIARHHIGPPTSASLSERPTDFNASRRLPLPDGVDMRYDLCEARVCSGSGCTQLSVQNDAYASAAKITLNQTLTSNRVGVLETECRFEVAAFMDDIWSPWLYFRQSVGFNLHHPSDVPPPYSFRQHHSRRLRLHRPEE